MPQTIEASHCYKCGLSANIVVINKSSGYCVTCQSEYALWQHRKRKYGITKQEFIARMDEQEGTCAICNIELTYRTANVDHCHKTGNVRGLLCNYCNTGLGKFKDDPALLNKAAKYLEL